MKSFREPRRAHVCSIGDRAHVRDLSHHLPPPPPHRGNQADLHRLPHSGTALNRCAVGPGEGRVLPQPRRSRLQLLQARVASSTRCSTPLASWEFQVMDSGRGSTLRPHVAPGPLASDGRPQRGPQASTAWEWVRQPLPPACPAGGKTWVSLKDTAAALPEVRHRAGGVGRAPNVLEAAGHRRSL